MMDQNSSELHPAGTSASPHLRRHLSGVGVLLLALSSLSPVLSAYGIGSDVLLHAGTGAAILFLLAIGGLGAVATRRRGRVTRP